MGQEISLTYFSSMLTWIQNHKFRQTKTLWSLSTNATEKIVGHLVIMWITRGQFPIELDVNAK